MKKIIIAICGIIIATGAMGSPEHYMTPWEVSFSPDPWKVNGGTYNNPISSDLYNHLENQVNKPFEGSHGTHRDEGAVVLIIARDIYKNGGEFCMTQIQAANADGYRYTWIDYYDYPGQYNCETLCVPGNYGKACEQTGIPDECDHKLDFGKYTRKQSGEWDNQITNKLKVFKVDNSEGTSTKTAIHRVLAVIKKMDHGVIVSPVEIQGERYKKSGDWYSYIKSAKSNGQKILLCAKGYKANDTKDDCIFMTELADKCRIDEMNFCDQGFKEEDHSNSELQIDIDIDKNCKKFVCKKGNDYILDMATKTCTKCERKFNQGINSNGECEQCEEPNGMFTNDGCKPYKKLSLLQLKKGFQGGFDCWQELGSDNYKKCVLCESPKSYNKTEKTCQ